MQNFNENLSALVMLGSCAGLSALGAEVRMLMAVLGLLVAATVGLLAWREALRQRQKSQQGQRAATG